MKLKHVLTLLATAICTTGGWAQTDVTSTYLENPGFEDCEPRTDNLAASSSAAGDDYEDSGWKLNSRAAWCASAVVAYDETGQVNGASAPANDNAGNSGNALGVSVGWSGTNSYRSTTAVTLPAGHYKLTVHAYNNSNKTSMKSVNGFVTTAEESYLSARTSFNSNTWIEDVIEFDLSENTEGKFQIGGTAFNDKSTNHAIVFFDNITLEYTDPAKYALQSAIDNAPDVPEDAKGDGYFQFSETNISNYAQERENAWTALNNPNATAESLLAAKTALEEAIENASNNKGKLFNITLIEEGYTDNDKSVTLVATNNGQGNYRFYYREHANQNLAPAYTNQAYSFTWVKEDYYRLSIKDSENNVYYLTDSKTGYGGDGKGIRVTDDKTKAAAFKIISTETDGVYNIYNEVAELNIGCQQNGFYSINSHNTLKIAEITKPSITINTTAAGWGTVILPFAAELPEGVKAYTCAAVDGATLTLAEVNALEANKPYIIEGAWNETLTGDAQGTELTNTVGLLTGTYARIYAPNGSYILQNNDSKVGFYLCDAADKYVVAKNRCYLTVSNETNVKAFFFGEQEDAINNIRHNVESINNIYDLTGRQVNKATKGIYIVNGKKVLIK